MPLISVIIPAYNAAGTIKATVESVLKQTLTDFEIVLINDGSKDNTLEVLNQIQDYRLKVFSYTNSGPQKSRNRGIAIATGEYVAFLDADDLWTPDKLADQYQALQSHPEAAVAYSWTNFVEPDGKLFRRGSYISATGDVYARLLLVDFIESGSNPLILKQAIETVGFLDESLLGGQDWDLWLRLAARYHFAVVPKAQILHKVIPGSWSSNVERQEKGFRQVLSKAFSNPSPKILTLRKDIIANRYKCLTVDALQRGIARRRGLTAARFFCIAISHDPHLLFTKVAIKVWLKILAAILLPPQWSQTLSAKMTKVTDISSLLGYLRLEPNL